VIHFLSIEDILYFHAEEIKAAGGAEEIRDLMALESAIGAPHASFGGSHLMDLFEMAATYVNSIIMNHPFMDGNKRTAAASALTFLFINGYTINEHYEEELADMILKLTIKVIQKNDLAQYFKDRSKPTFNENQSS